jgi:hypothetical protein
MCSKYFTLLLISAVLLCRFGAASANSDIDWVPLDGLSEALKLEMKHMRIARCLPESSDVDLPIYPDATVISVTWGKVAPQCLQRDGWDDLGAIVFASRADKNIVVEWYARELPKYLKYREAVGTILIKNEIDDFLWERDYAKYSNITITLPSDEFWDAGYRSFIELNRPKEGMKETGS